MSTVNPTIDDVVGNGQVMKFTWALTTADNDGAPIPPQFADHSDRTVYFTGTWNGATASWEGGDNSVWMTLADVQGTGIAKTANGIEVVVESPEYSRPRLTTVGVGAVITATCIARRGYRRGG
jgi:hypothetical protein